MKKMNTVILYGISHLQLFSKDSPSQWTPNGAMEWLCILSQSNDLFLNEVCMILDQNLLNIKELLSVTDERGRKAIDIATPEYKKAIMDRTYFHRRFEFKSGPAEHVSATSVVLLAIDHLEGDRAVALKFICHKCHYLRELSVRKFSTLSDKYVINTILSFDGDEDKKFLEETQKRGLFPYCVVMPAAERNLSAVLAHEHIAGRDWDKIRLISKQLVAAVGHLHEQGLVHGDIKPLNVMRLDGDYRLIDLDACVSYRDCSFIGAKFSSGFVPPEMIAPIITNNSNNEISTVVRSYTSDEGGTPILEDLPYILLEANPSFDIWSLGVTLYQLFTGESLFNTNDEGNIDEEQRRILMTWNEEFKSKRLLKVNDVTSRNLLSRLLSKESTKRPDVNHILSHPFFTGKNTARLIGESAQYDVFISYRVNSDSHHAKYIYEELTKNGLKVWWDQQSLQPGVPWEEGFCDGLVNSKAFLPILSRGAINHPTNDRQNFSKLTNDSYCDNVLLEYRLALELKCFGLIEFIYPVMIGDHQNVHCIEDNRYTNYFTDGCHPKVSEMKVTAIEDKLREHLSRQGLGEPLIIHNTVKDTLNEITACQGGFVQGDGYEAFDNIIKSILQMILNKNDMINNNDNNNISNVLFETDHNHSNNNIHQNLNLEIIKIQNNYKKLLKDINNINNFLEKSLRCNNININDHKDNMNSHDENDSTTQMKKLLSISEGLVQELQLLRNVQNTNQVTRRDESTQFNFDSYQKSL